MPLSVPFGVCRPSAARAARRSAGSVKDARRAVAITGCSATWTLVIWRLFSLWLSAGYVSLKHRLGGRASIASTVASSQAIGPANRHFRPRNLDL